MNVLITGSSGQIGTNLGLRLMDRGDTVVGIDHRANAWTDRIDTRLIDLTKTAGTDLPDDVHVDVLVHLAAHAKVFELVENPARAMENIAMGFAALEYARQHDIPIIFGSSREVYGDIHRHVTNEAEADFVIAESPYSASKMSTEAMIYAYSRCYGLPYLVLRFSNVYGRYDNDLERMERVIPLFIKRINEGQPIRVFGREKVLDFTYVDDCTAGIVQAIDALTAARVVNETANLAYGRGNSLGDLVGLIEMALGKQANATWDEPQAGEVTHYVADLHKARKLLGYDPKTSLVDGIVRYITWQREEGML